MDNSSGNEQVPTVEGRGNNEVDTAYEVEKETTEEAKASQNDQHSNFDEFVQLSKEIENRISKVTAADADSDGGGYDKQSSPTILDKSEKRKDLEEGRLKGYGQVTEVTLDDPIMSQLPEPLPSPMGPETGLPGAYAVAGRPRALGRNRNPFYETGQIATPPVEDEPEEQVLDPLAPENALHAELVAPNIDATCLSGTASSTTSSMEEGEKQNPSPQTMVIDGHRIKEHEETFHGMSKRFLFCSIAGIGLLVLIVVILSVGISGGFEPDETSLATNADPAYETESTESTVDVLFYGRNASTLAMIQARGKLIAHTSFGDDGTGLGPKLAKAIAAGIFGNPTVDIVQMGIGDLFKSVVNGTVDISLTGFTHTMDRDVYMSFAQSPLAFSVPYAYEGVQVAGDPFYVDCADNGMKHLDECSGIKVCVTKDTTHYEALLKYLPERFVDARNKTADGGVYAGLIQGQCNLIAYEQRGLRYEYASQQSYNGTYLDMNNFVVAEMFLSREPIGAMHRRDDPEFSDFVNTILWSLMAAEKLNITKETAGLIPQTTLFGDDYKDMFRNAVATAGNFGDIHDNLLLSRSSLDYLNDGSSGLLYPHPFGQLGNDRDGYPLGATLTSILQSGVLRCGIRCNRPGFATQDSQGYAGMDVDYCRAVAAALFGDYTDTLVFVKIEEDIDGYSLLASNEIDLLAGATWTLENDVREPSTGQGYSFSTPYFYGYSDSQDNFCLATRQDDADWSSFVYWVVTGTVYAEDNGIGAGTFHEMPEVFVFGPDLRQMFRSSVLAVGSYAEIYERNLEALIPRGGRNVLNNLGEIGPQHYVIPGLPI